VDYDFGTMPVNELFDAIRNGDAAMVASLIAAEPSLIDSRQNDISPILFAVYNGHADVAQVLIEHGARPSFAEACALGDTESVLRMLAADPSLLDSFSEDGFPAVGLAVFFRHPELARALIERGADVNAASRNAFRVAPVHAAAATRDGAIMQLLIEHGADVNARQQLGYTALHTAAQLGDQIMLDLLLAAGADPRAAGEDGKTPADLAAAHGHTAIAERLS
jgi:ankyrin repeat protein